MLIGTAAGVLAMIAAAGLAALAWHELGTTEYARFVSPDGSHRLVVYRHPRLFAMPGQGSDAPGTIVLETMGGRQINSRRLEMVQLISQPRWEADRVSMKLLLDWRLQP